MNRMLDTDADPVSYGRRDSFEDQAADHEISLGIPTLLGIFFALALVCAGFFGAGYSAGRRSVPAPTPAVEETPLAASGISKPTAGSAAASPAQRSAEDADVVAPPAASVSSAAKERIAPADGRIAGDPAPPPVAASTAGTAPRVSVEKVQAAALPKAAAPAGVFVVQVAAVSTQDVADILVSSLQKKGYAVSVRHEPQDKLLHVQLGPFPDKKTAEATRQRVLADGFNAIVK